MRFLFRWQRVDERMHGLDGAGKVFELLDGVSVPAAAWEEDVLPARVDDYDGTWLDQLCLSGQVEWTRIDAVMPSSTSSGGARRNGSVAGTLRAAPIAIVERAHSHLFERAVVDEDALSADARAVLAVLRPR